MDVVGFMMRFEDEGDLSAEEVIDGFAYLITSNLIWGLQGFYGRYARDLIDAGWIDPDGTVLSYPDSEF